MFETMGGRDAQVITSQPLVGGLVDVVSAYAAMWTAPNAVPLKGLGRLLFQPPAKRPDRLAVAKYLAGWYAEATELVA
jgi:hypothetical protein